MNKKFWVIIQERAKIPIHTFYEANLKKKWSTAPMIKPYLYTAKKIRLKDQKTKISIKTLATPLWNSQIVSEIPSTILLNARMVRGWRANFIVLSSFLSTFQNNTEYGKHLSYSEDFEPYHSLTKIAREIDLRGSQISKLLPCTWKVQVFVWFKHFLNTLYGMTVVTITVHSKKCMKRLSKHWN